MRDLKASLTTFQRGNTGLLKYAVTCSIRSHVVFFWLNCVYKLDVIREHKINMLKTHYQTRNKDSSASMNEHEDLTETAC